MQIPPLGILVGKHCWETEAPATAPRLLAGRLALCETSTYKLLGQVRLEAASLTVRPSVDGKGTFVADLFGGTVTVAD